MSEISTYKKVKKQQTEKKAEAQIQEPLINEEDENFLTRIVSAEGSPPPLPERRPHSSEVCGTGDSHEHGHDASSTIKGKENEKPIDKKKSHRFSFLHKRNSKKASFPFPNPQFYTLIHPPAGETKTQPRRLSGRSHQGKRRRWGTHTPHPSTEPHSAARSTNNPSANSKT